MINFEYLNKADFSSLSRKLFNILADNMEKIAPTGNLREDDYKCWYEGVSQRLCKVERQIILIKDNGSLIGFFQYYTDSHTFMMEEIQFMPSYQGTGLFRKLYGFILKNINPDLEFVEAYANKENLKSQEILSVLGLHVIGTNKSGSCFHYKGSFQDLIKWYNK